MRKENFALIVSDNNGIAKLCKYFKIMGYEVLSEHTGSKAILCLEKTGDLIKTVIVDGNIPDMDFSVFYREIEKIRPKICCIFSGEKFDFEEQENIFVNSNFAFLKIPFTFRDLNASLISLYTKELAGYGVIV